MTKREFIEILTLAFEKRLCPIGVASPTCEEIAEIALQVTKEVGMLPPVNACKLIDDGKGGIKHNASLREWDDETV